MRSGVESGSAVFIHQGRPLDDSTPVSKILANGGHVGMASAGVGECRFVRVWVRVQALMPCVCSCCVTVLVLDPDQKVKAFFISAPVVQADRVLIGCVVSLLCCRTPTARCRTIARKCTPTTQITVRGETT